MVFHFICHTLFRTQNIVLKILILMQKNPKIVKKSQTVFKFGISCLNKSFRNQMCVGWTKKNEKWKMITIKFFFLFPSNTEFQVELQEVDKLMHKNGKFFWFIQFQYVWIWEMIEYNAHNRNRSTYFMDQLLSH